MKNKKGLIIGAIAVVVLAIIIVAALYFFTDVFKSNQQLFHESIGKIEIGNNAFLKEYQTVQERINQNSNSSAAEMYAAISRLNTETGIADVQKLFLIKSNGLKNTVTDQEYRDFSVSFAENNEIILKLIKDNNTYGLGADNILAKYVAIENSNLKEFAAKLGIDDTEEIPDSIQKIDLEELLKVDSTVAESIKSTYTNLFNSKVTESNYYKISNRDKTTTYGLSLSSEETRDLIKSILETAKNDSALLNLMIDKAKLLGYKDLTIEKIQETTQKLIDKISESNEENNIKDFIKFEIINNRKDPVKIKMEINYPSEDEYLETNDVQEENKEKMFNHSITLDFQEVNQIEISEVTNNVEMLKMVVNYTMDETTIKTNSDISIQQDEKTYRVKLQEQIDNYKADNINITLFADFDTGSESTFQLNYTNNIMFKDDIQISKITSENSVKLNDMTTEEIIQLITAINNRVKEVYGEDILLQILNPIMTYRIQSSANETANDAMLNLDENGYVSNVTT